jgi:hypothetical protein
MKKLKYSDVILKIVHSMVGLRAPVALNSQGLDSYNLNRRTSQMLHIGSELKSKWVPNG